jgi:hypothetical protein
MVNFCYDDLGSYGIGYPNLAQKNLDPDQFDHVWPRTTPLRLLMYFKTQGIPVASSTVDRCETGSWYPVSLAWHDFECDYFALMSKAVRDAIKHHHVRVLFYYHEADAPDKIKTRIDYLCDLHGLPKTYLFVSANSASSTIENFYHFPDHEYFFRYVNRHQSPKPIKQPCKAFTLLNRTHKTWRANIVADLHAQGLLDNSLWSYNTDCIMSGADTENPLRTCELPDWDHITSDFLSNGPYLADTNDADLHNDHAVINTNLYTDTWCHIVIETMLDADGSGGSFLTEKTYKCIKYGQPFIIIGTAGSLSQLRDHGFRTFDSVIDSSYDTIKDTTDRYLYIRNIIKNLSSQVGPDWYKRCLPDVLHNQELFLGMRNPALSKLAMRLQT